MFGPYRAPTGVGEAAAAALGEQDLSEVREEVAQLQATLGRRPKILVAKPGLDGHSNGAEQIALRARDAGMDVVYEGIRLTPAQIATSALQEGVHVIGLSILSGSHRELIPAVMDALRDAGVHVPVVVGGIIPEQDVAGLRAAGVAAVYTPKDFDITRIMRDIVALLAASATPGNARRRAPRSQQRRVSAAGAALGRRLRERDLSAAPQALNLLESSTFEDREQAAALLAELAPSALGGEAAGHVIGVTGPPGVGKSTLLSALLGCWRARGLTVALLAVDPSSRRSGGALLGDRARIEFDAADSGVLIRSSAAGERLGGIAPATRRRCARARCSLRRRRDRDRRRRADRD